MKFSGLPLKPSGVLVMRPADWSPTIENRPTGDVAIGLRPLSPGDAIEARQLAAEKAWEDYPKEPDNDLRVEAFNDAVMRFVIARGTCDPNDAKKRSDLWMGIEDEMVFAALTRQGARRVFDAIEAAEIATRVDQREATDEDIRALPELFAAAVLPPLVAARCRRLLGHVLETLKGEASE